jgi:hypothetical protein
MIAAADLGLPAGRCCLVQDATARICAGGMVVFQRGRLGVSDLVVTSLREIAIDPLAGGRLWRRAA